MLSVATPSDAAIDGIAVLSTVESSISMKNATATSHGNSRFALGVTSGESSGGIGVCGVERSFVLVVDLDDVAQRVVVRARIVDRQDGTADHARDDQRPVGAPAQLVASLVSHDGR